MSIGHYLLTVPGFGPDISSKVLGAIANPFRFDKGTQILKMAGLDLSAKRSGKRSDPAVPVISKKEKAFAMPSIRAHLLLPLKTGTLSNVSPIRFEGGKGGAG